MSVDEPIRLGVIGLGRAFTLMLPTFLRDSRVRLVAATDPRREARERFAADFAAQSYESAEALCADPQVQAVYVASPHQFHVEHVRIAAAQGKHILVEKPMALTVTDARSMIEAARAGGTHLIVGHSHSFDTPYLRTRELARSGAYGHVRMINALNFTDFLYRPRRPEELDTRMGGGVVFSQAAHQVDVVRLLAGVPAVSVRALTGSWDQSRPTEGAYNAQIKFINGVFASLTYSGYGRFDTDEFNSWVGELGQPRDPERYGAARAALAGVASPEAEIDLKNQRAYGASGVDAFRGNNGLAHNHFGLIIVSCDHADLRPMPEGIMIYADAQRQLEPLGRPGVPRAEVIDELRAVVRDGAPPLHSGEWGLATLEICLAILQSMHEDREVKLYNQV